jgi:hypothetical protein
MERQSMRQIAKRISAATMPRKQRVHNPVRHAWLKIKSMRSCRVAAITRDTATRTGRIQRRYSTEIAIMALANLAWLVDQKPLG